MKKPFAFLWATVTILLLSLPAAAANLTVATAADLRLAMTNLVQRYQTIRHVAITPIYGSSGKFYSQIVNGAPFDAFFSADERYPRMLELRGLTVPGTRFRYGIGRLVLWTRADSGIDVREGMKVLLDPNVHAIAIANPQHAPYGEAALEALKKAKIYGRTKDRLILGENISQTAQYAASGNAQVGFIALALTKTPGLRSGHDWSVPQSLYKELEQEAVILKGSHHRKQLIDFFTFVRSPEGRAILASYGFTQ